jgi:hypothetical protein
MQYLAHCRNWLMPFGSILSLGSQAPECAAQLATNCFEEIQRIIDYRSASCAYQDFFTLWKDADPDIPILKQASGVAKLQ